MAQSNKDPISLTTSDQDNSTLEENVPNLLAKISKYETQSQNSLERIKVLENELKAKDNDLVSLTKQLEEQFAEVEKIKSQNAKEAEEIAALKFKSEDTLTRAKSMIFDKTKVIKNQELQIEALNQQITSLKEVVSITKDLLEIRNLEVNQLETKMQCMEDKISAEKERHDLMHKKLEHMIRYNGDLKREYETQLCLFTALRERYSERELARGVIADSQPGTSVTTESTVTATETSGTNATTTETPGTNVSTTDTLTNAATTEIPATNTAVTETPPSNAATAEIAITNVATAEIPVNNTATTESSVNNAATIETPETTTPTTDTPAVNVVPLNNSTLDQKNNEQVNQ